MLDEAIEENPEDYEKYIVGHIQAAMLFALSWGVGGVLNTESREKFDAYLRKVRIHFDLNPLLSSDSSSGLSEFSYTRTRPKHQRHSVKWR